MFLKNLIYCLSQAILIGTLFFAQAEANEANKVTYKDITYDIYKVTLDNDSSIQFFWKNPIKREIFKSIDNVKSWVENNGDILLFATNGGIYTQEYVPLGLYIENKKQLMPLNLKKGRGNFYLKPNGVFSIGSDGAKIIKSEDFNATFKKDSIFFAVQSGPMLVIKNNINPKFDSSAKSTYIRNGVGIIASNTVIFAISNQPVNLYDFASLFKDKLNCTNALYLDGAISTMYLPEIGRNDSSGNFGSIIGVVKKDNK